MIPVSASTAAGASCAAGCLLVIAQHAGHRQVLVYVGPVDADAAADELPCIWKRLRKLVSKNRTKNAKKLHVNDSKVVYAYDSGLKEIERAILALLATRGLEHIDRLEDFIGRCAAHAISRGTPLKWSLVV